MKHISANRLILSIAAVMLSLAVQAQDDKATTERVSLPAATLLTK